MATASSDYDLRLWGLDTGAFLAAFTAEAPLSSVVMSQSDLVVVAGDELGNLHFLHVEGLAR